ncbi:MAG: hypothetical protein AAFN41_05930, partial [Planctomycetota bacterium]
MKTTSPAALVFSGLMGAAASAQPIVLTVDPAQSSLDVEIEIVSPVGTETDSDSSPVQGTTTIELDDLVNPTSITLSDYAFTATEPLDYFYDFGFFGTVTVTGTDVGITLPAGFPPEVAPVAAGTGAFGLPEIDTQVVGTAGVTSTGIIGNTVGAATFDLGTDTKPDVFAATGTVSVSGSTVTVTITVPFQTTQEQDLGVVFNIGGTATVIATGTIPDDPCPADTNGDGALDPADFNAWVIAFNTQAPECDQNGDGLCNPADFNSWV